MYKTGRKIKFRIRNDTAQHHILYNGMNVESIYIRILDNFALSTYYYINRSLRNK